MKIFFIRALLFLVGVAFTVAATEADSDVQVLTTSNFEEIVNNAKLIMVEFYAPWCGHCKALAPEYEKAATSLKDSGIILAKVDCTVEQDVCANHGVQGYPTIKVFRDGKPSEYNKARKADAIIGHLEKQLLPAVSNVTAENFDSFSTKDKVVVIGFFEFEKTPEYETFSSVANRLRDDYVFGAVFDAALAKKENVKIPGVVLYKKFDEKKNVYPENVDIKLMKQNDDSDSHLNEDSLEKFISINAVPLVNDIGPENYGKYIESGLPLAFAFVSTDEHRETIGPIIEKAAKKHRGKINFVYIDAAQFGGHATNLNLKEEWPAFAIQDVLTQSKFPFDQSKEITDAQLTKFIDDFVAGDVKPSIKSAPIPEDNSAPVKIVVADNFEDIVLNKENDVFVEFYAPWCGHCKRLAPIWDELGEKVASAKHITIAKMDATENDIPPGQPFQIEGFPTLKFFKAGTNEVVDYLGDRSLEAFISFLKENSSKPFEVSETFPEETDESDAHDEL